MRSPKKVYAEYAKQAHPIALFVFWAGVVGWLMIGYWLINPESFDNFSFWLEWNFDSPIGNVFLALLGFVMGIGALFYVPSLLIAVVFQSDDEDQ